MYRKFLCCISVLIIIIIFVFSFSVSASEWTDYTVPFNEWFPNLSLDDDSHIATLTNHLDYSLSYYPSRYWIANPSTGNLDGCYVPTHWNDRVVIGYSYDFDPLPTSFTSPGLSIVMDIPLGFVSFDLLAGDSYRFSFPSAYLYCKSSFATFNSAEFVFLVDYKDGKSETHTYTFNRDYFTTTNNNSYTADMNGGNDVYKDCTVSLKSIIYNTTLVSNTVSGVIQFRFLKGVTFSFGNSNTPESPKYPPLDSSEADKLEDKEHELLAGITDGRDLGNNFLSGLNGNVDKFYPTLSAISAFMADIVGVHGSISMLVQMSAGIGIACVIIGAGFSAVNRVANKHEASVRANRKRGKNA